MLGCHCGVSRAGESDGVRQRSSFGRLRLAFLRLEVSKDGKFVDEPTLFAYDRTSMLLWLASGAGRGDNRYEIVTSALTINYHDDGFPFSTSNLMVLLRSQRQTQSTNRFLPKNNLGGTVETLTA